MKMFMLFLVMFGMRFSLDWMLARCGPCGVLGEVGNKWAREALLYSGIAAVMVPVSWPFAAVIGCVTVYAAWRARKMWKADAV